MRFKLKTMKTKNKIDDGNVHSYTVKIIKKKLPTTVQMVDNTLIKLHKIKGISLQFIYNTIIREYTIKKTTKRYNLVKKRLIELKELGYITNATGTGLVGRFKLLNKNEFVKKFIFKDNNKKPNRKKKSNPTLKKFLSIKSNFPNNLSSRHHVHTPTGSNVDNVNSWIFSNHVNNSTPFMEVAQAPPAPVVNKKARKRIHEANFVETPRSSKGKSRRNESKT